MVLVIAFLTVTNIALGYGLAVYVNRHFGILVPSRSRSLVNPQQNVTEAPSAMRRVEELPTMPPQRTSVVAEQPGLEARPQAVAASVDEENVLAGIEEFRSQLAKMNTPAELPTTATSEATELALSTN